MRREELLESLVLEAVHWSLSEAEGIEFVATYDPRNKDVPKIQWKRISRSTYYKYKKKAMSDETLNEYFNEHTRIGFIQKQRMREAEMEQQLAHLKKRFLDLAGKENTDVYRLCHLAREIRETNKRAEEIALGNPTIAKIKMEVEIANGGSVKSTEQDGSSSAPEALSNFKF